MKTIWKYTMNSEGGFLMKERLINMPKGAQIISVGEQHNNVCFWAVVDPDAKMHERRFVVVGTGHDMPDLPLKPLGSVLVDGGVWVWHLFEVIGS